MKRGYLIALAGLIFAPEAVRSQVPASPKSLLSDTIETGQTCSYFGESIPAKVTPFASDAEAESVVKEIVDATGLFPHFDVMAAGVPNAAAIIKGAKRLILYDQYFVRSLREMAGTRWAPISVMAHEIAHHLNGHTLEATGSRPAIELESDYYSGFVLQRMGATMTEARVAMEKFGSTDGSTTHPPKHDRLAAISNGWTKACETDPKCHQEADSEVRQRPVQDEPDTRKLEKSRPRRGRDSCEYANDGACDEPDRCDRGTDTSDCKADKVVTDPVTERQFGRSCCMFNGGRCGPFLDQPAYPIGDPCSCQYGNPNASGRVCSP